MTTWTPNPDPIWQTIRHQGDLKGSADESPLPLPWLRSIIREFGPAWQPLVGSKEEVLRGRLEFLNCGLILDLDPHSFLLLQSLGRLSSQLEAHPGLQAEHGLTPEQICKRLKSLPPLSRLAPVQRCLLISLVRAAGCTAQGVSFPTGPQIWSQVQSARRCQEGGNCPHFAPPSCRLTAAGAEAELGQMMSQGLVKSPGENTWWLGWQEPSQNQPKA